MPRATVKSLSPKVRDYMKKFPSVKKLKLSKSDKPNKRFKATFEVKGEKKTIHFGLDTATTFADGAPIEKMRSYKARASKIKNKKGKYTYKIAGTANSFAYWLLW